MNCHGRADAATAPDHPMGSSQPPSPKKALSLLFFLISILLILEQL